MRDFHRPGRSPVYATEHAAATSHPVATATALDVLAQGGNAVDAAIAAAAVLAVVEPHMTGIGGDCFVLLCPGGGADVVALNGSGQAPAAARHEWYLERGIREITAASPHSVTVPGAVAAWERLHRDHGRRDWESLWRPAIRLAREGYAVHPRVAFDWANNQEKLAGDEIASRLFLSAGKPPRTGSRQHQPLLAASMETIAAKGAAGFYQGPIAADLVGRLQALGGLHTLDDFAAQTAEYVEPIQTSYSGHDVHECPPNGRGIAALLMLRILEPFGIADMDPLSVGRLHLQAEAAKLAFRAADTFLGDPRQARIPTEWMLSDPFIGELRSRIRPDRALEAEQLSMPSHPDTIYLTVVDRDRNAISYINSLYQAFGSAITGPESGIVLQNRGMGFVIEPAHPNCIAPGKRPLHTIIPAMVTRAGQAIMPFGVMGGAYQPIGQVQVLMNILEYGMDVQEAIDLPRSASIGGVYQLERGIPEDTAEGLRRLGHAIERVEAPLGGGQAIWIDWQEGTLIAASDPRKDGCALGR